LIVSGAIVGVAIVVEAIVRGDGAVFFSIYVVV